MDRFEGSVESSECTTGERDIASHQSVGPFVVERPFIDPREPHNGSLPSLTCRGQRRGIAPRPSGRGNLVRVPLVDDDATFVGAAVL
jgi:hypothetical protein